MNKYIFSIFFAFICINSNAGVRLKEIGRFEGVRDNQLVGYGIVVGLASTGDSSRSKNTVQSIANTLIEFGLTLNSNDIRSRNVASVMVTATLPPFSDQGDKIDVSVSSLGDAKSLAGGTLVMTPLKASNGQIFAIAQGPLSVGGFAYDSFDSKHQKNHPTVATISNGALIERSTKDVILDNNNSLNFIINEPDFSTLDTVITEIERNIPSANVTPVHAGKVNIQLANKDPRLVFNAIAKIERIEIEPDQTARIVINERTGTLVAGGEVKISPVTISHGSLRLTVDTRYDVSQPFFIGRDVDGVQTRVVPDTKIEVREQPAGAVELNGGGTVADLVEALRGLNVTTRDIIIIIQSIKKAGALKAALIVE